METYLERQIERSMHDVSKVYDEVENKHYIVDQIGRTISTVSSQYKLVKNSEVVQPIIDHFGMDKVVNFQQNGRAQYCYELKTGRSFEVAEGDRLEERIHIINSYDKSKAFLLGKGAFRFFCSNGMFTIVAGSVYKKIHVGDIPVEELVANCISEINDGIEYDLWELMAREKTTEYSEIDFVDNHLKLFDYKDEYSPLADKEKRIKYSTKKFDRGESHTVWGLYNRLNSSIASVLGTRNTRNLMSVNHRMEEQVQNFFLN